MTDIDVARAEVRSMFKPVTRPPSMRRVNGCGFTLLGFFKHRSMGDGLIAAHGFSLFFVPIWTTALYLVTEGPPGVFRFHATISQEDLARLFPEASSTLSTSRAKEAAMSVLGFVIAIVFVGFVFAGLKQLFRHH